MYEKSKLLLPSYIEISELKNNFNWVQTYFDQEYYLPIIWFVNNSFRVMEKENNSSISQFSFTGKTYSNIKVPKCGNSVYQKSVKREIRTKSLYT